MFAAPELDLLLLHRCLPPKLPSIDGQMMGSSSFPVVWLLLALVDTVEPSLGDPTATGHVDDPACTGTWRPLP